MNVSSVSSYSDTLWEEYLERLRKKQQQKESQPISETAGAATSAVSSVPAPDEILSELQELQDDPEQLKARASELAAQVAEEAENSAGVRANALNELASDLEEVADSGDLSVLQEKLAGKSGAARPQGPPPGGMGGASGVSSKLMEALIEEEDDENSSGIDDIKAFLGKIQELAEEKKSKISDAQFSSELTPEKILAELETLRDDPERLKARASELAGQLKGDTGLRAEAALPLVADLEEIAESGDLSKLREKASRTSPGTIKPGNEYASLGLESLVSKFQALKEMSASNTPDAAGDSDETEGAAAKNQTSANDLISKIKAGLSDRFIAIYAQRQIPVSTVSLSG